MSFEALLSYIIVTKLFNFLCYVTMFYCDDIIDKYNNDKSINDCFVFAYPFNFTIIHKYLYTI